MEANSWKSVPSGALELIFSFLPQKDRFHASASCIRWREHLYLPQLWKTLKIVARTRNDALRVDFYTRKGLAAYVRYLEVCWPESCASSLKTRQLNEEILKSLAQFLRAVGDHNTRLKSLNLKLANEASEDPQFVEDTTKSVVKIIENCNTLECLSFGHYPCVAGPEVLKRSCGGGSPKQRPRMLSETQELHVTRTFGLPSTGLEYFGRLWFDSLINLHTLSFNWEHTTPLFLESLCARPKSAARLQKLSLYVDGRCFGPHPSEEHWGLVTKLYPDLKIFLIVDARFDACDCIDITGNVFMLKFIHYSGYGDTFFHLIATHSRTLQALVFLSSKTNSDQTAEMGDELFRLNVVFYNIRVLAFLGCFVSDIALQGVGRSFPNLDRLMVSKAHIVTEAKATSYMVPISGSKYTHLKNTMTTVLGQPWNALPRIPSELYLFGDGKDDEFYLRGKLPETRCKPINS